ncbi:MAG: PAS domain-containing protein, partial [Salegentibacter mishustinae]|nr:PAS domain-containing protein [Salegentibacter mishustinae]
MLESDTSKLSKKELNIIQNYTEGLFKTVREPLLVLDRHRNVVGLNSNLKKKFKINGEFEERVSVFEFNNGQLDTPEFRDILNYLQTEGNTVTERDIQVVLPQKRKRGFTVNASVLPLPDENSIILLSFKKLKNIGDLSRQEKVYNRLVENILSNAPAAICILRGREHTFEVANEHYIELIGHRDIIGKTVKEAIPEAESQGFIELLDHVYSTGEPYIGNETPLKLKVGKDEFKNSHLNFVYQPTR